jgi:molybdenum storage protein
MDQDDLIIEPPCLEIFQTSEVIEKISIINGTVPGLITKALSGKAVGMFIYRDRQAHWCLEPFPHTRKN